MIRSLFDNIIAEDEPADKAISLKNDKRPAKEIFMPSTEERKSLEKMLDCFTVADLKEDKAPCYQLARKYRLYYIDKKGQEQCPPAIAKMISGQKTLKRDWVSFLAIMLYHRNLHLFYDGMTDGERKLLEKALLTHFVPEDEAAKILGEKCTHKVKGYYYEITQLIPKLAFWYTRGDVTAYDPAYKFNRYKAHKKHLSLQSGSRRQLAKALHPEYLEPVKVDAIPGDEKLATYQNEQAIHTILPMLRVMYKTNQIDFGSSKCTATTVKKVAKMTGVREFFQTADKDGSRLAALLLTNVYCLDALENGVADYHVEDDIKSIWIDVSQTPEYFPALILNHVTGFRKNQMMFCHCEEMCDHLVAVLRQGGDDDKWMETESVCRAVRFLNDDSERHCLWISQYEFDKMTVKNNYNDRDICYADIITDLTYPFMRGVLFMMAVFGMAEIAYDPKPSADASCFYDALRYVRLTPLGKYALGITDKYEQPKTKPAAKMFELYDDNLMVKSVAEVNPCESVLGNMATLVSKHLYKMSYETFLDGCDCKSDITNKIQLFHDYVCPEPPANWQQFFHEMEDRCKLLKAPQKKYSLLQIPADRKDLQRIVLNDPVVRKYSLKAEGLILLVETANKGKVVDALKKYGYLL